MCAELAAGIALASGLSGVKLLVDVAQEGDFSSESQEAIKAIWLAGSNQPLPEAGAYLSSLLGADIPVNGSVRQKASESFDDLVLASKDNAVLFSKLLSIASSDSIKHQVHGSGNEFTERLIRIFSAGSISVSTALIDKFEALIAKDLREEEYQRYLNAHPIILDPLAAEIVPKHRLGSDYITDFVIRRHDGRYLVVEIEKPQDRIFTAAGDFTAPFSHALGQVLDFQGWVAEQNSYARSKLPHIENPRGLLVMGRRSDLTEHQERKLRRWCANSNSIDVVTFDDLVSSGRQLLASLRRFDEG
ncbi:Shedu anti-phage system protein SduA domain-containing protein [Micromonospora profundi]|uniref:Shedu anti-phage system protein SduA domain-containing protein n=1 Tax=Micromonospora profundi TaxID=1420889 RepID=UPI00339F64F3